MNQNDDITKLKGVGEKTRELFSRLLINKIRDLLTFYPRDYFTYPLPVTTVAFDENTGYLYDVSDENESEIIPEGQIALLGRIKNPVTVKKTRSMDIALGRLFVGNANNAVELVWFRMAYIKNQVIPGKEYVFYGNLKKEGGKYKLEQPKVFVPADYIRLCEKLLPVYPLTKGLSGEKMRKFISLAFDMTNDISEFIPDEIIKSRKLPAYREALYHIHFPDDKDDYLRCRDRLVYNEFMTFALTMKMEIAAEEKIANDLKLPKRTLYDKVRSSLPFKLTAGQESALGEIESDLFGDAVTQRLIQGDVGSGKTIVAFLAMVLLAENGYQSAIMAPTEVLASQHYETFAGLMEEYDLPFKAILLTGSMTAKEKRIAREAISSGDADLIIGTHAVFQDKVEYDNLALVITDEQHRFGVKQRLRLTEKGANVFSIVMSATPIPRTLAMIIYTGMQISVISELPASRLPIKNSLVGPEKRQAAYSFIRKQLAEGHQAMIICPMVESGDDNEDNAPENVEDYTKKIKPLFPEYKVAGLHGRMKSEEKDRIMADFAANKTQILVSTTVIEVGINVPNSTVIMIENANRFGLAQLHQLRGRVGRGSFQSYCIFIDTSKGKNKSDRLKMLTSSNDGFEIANYDLKTRGPGDIMGIRQSGDFEFKLADIYQDSGILKWVKEDSDAILEADPDLSLPGNHALLSYLRTERDNAYTNL